jgi:thiol-disulfide isomerase/thioredoxin
MSLVGNQAPEFSRLRGWLNTPPLTMGGLKGKIVLLDFWTFSCVNCVRTLPHMKQLHMMYGGDRFVLVGVHTPEFEFEKLPENVADAVKRFRIEYPVAIDSENVTWKLYGNQYWPRQTLIDASGRVRWEHAGEGDYDKMENQIRELLKEAGRDPAGAKANSSSNASEKSTSWSHKITSEIYLGSLRSDGFGNGQVCVPGNCSEYIDPKQHSRDIPYLNGAWTQFPEYIMHETTKPGHVLLKYEARNANAVLGALKMKPVRVDVLLDGKPLSKEKAGADVQWDSEGSYLTVAENRLYDIIRTRDYETHELKLATSANDLCLYTYTFG